MNGVWRCTAGIGEKDAPLFRNHGAGTGQAHRMTQPDAYLTIERRAHAVSIKTKVAITPSAPPAFRII